MFSKEKQILNKYLTNDQILYVESKIKEPINSLIPLSGGVTNTTYKLISQSGKKYALRIPGKGTNNYINRMDEMNNISIIDSLNIMPRVICSDPDSGILITDYICNSHVCTIEDVYNPVTLKKICQLLYKIHISDKQFYNEFNIPKTQNMYRNYLKKLGGKSPESLLREEQHMDRWMDYLFLNYPKELISCHIDPKLNNFLEKDSKLYLIDWEYSGMADLYFELANFTLVNNLTQKEETLFIDNYCQVSSIDFIYEKYLLYKFATDYLWIYWHLIKCQQNTMIDYNEMSWKKRLLRAKKTLSKIGNSV